AALLLFQRDAGRLLEQDRGRRALDDELEAPVAVNRDDHRHRDAAHLLRAVVKLAHELADVHAVLTERRTHRRRRRRLAARHLETNLSNCLLRHACPLVSGESCNRTTHRSTRDPPANTPTPPAPAGRKSSAPPAPSPSPRGFP